LNIKLEKSKTMHRADIRAALIKAGKNQTVIADELGVSDNAVSLVISGRATSRRIANAIAKATGISIYRLWPGRYVNRRQFRRAA
jgi:lambda repressor-like predicted transcriptional regulator